MDWLTGSQASVKPLVKNTFGSGKHKAASGTSTFLPTALPLAPLRNTSAPTPSLWLVNDEDDDEARSKSSTATPTLSEQLLSGEGDAAALLASAALPPPPPPARPNRPRARPLLKARLAALDPHVNNQDPFT